MFTTSREDFTWDQILIDIRKFAIDIVMQRRELALLTEQDADTVINIANKIEEFIIGPVPEGAE